MVLALAIAALACARTAFWIEVNIGTPAHTCFIMFFPTKGRTFSTSILAAFTSALAIFMAALAVITACRIAGFLF